MTLKEWLKDVDLYSCTIAIYGGNESNLELDFKDQKMVNKYINREIESIEIYPIDESMLQADVRLYYTYDENYNIYIDNGMLIQMINGEETIMESNKNKALIRFGEIKKRCEIDNKKSAPARSIDVKLRTESNIKNILQKENVSEENIDKIFIEIYKYIRKVLIK